MHTYDLFGWYAGSSFPDRVADVAPGNLSETTVAGELRANWTGYAWVDLPYAPPPEIVHLPASVEEYDAALTAHLDAVAQSRRWQDRIACAARAGYAGPWQQDAIAFGCWMDQCNLAGYQILADYKSGLIQQPTIDEVIAALPPMVWPSEVGNG